ncbi:hypothetical protein QYF36_005769 [Acer negundo]|nr:hypothetical protein QYF36_005769 [Acer negundo]
MALAGRRRPKRNLLSVSLNLSGVFEDDMYVGFTASTGQLVESHKILAWSFSNSSFSLSEKLITAGWEKKVLHRDIKASNVLLDKEMKGSLGDFGLARMHSHGQVANTTRVVGTVGYLAPEVISTGRASTQTDVFGFGVLILEVMCGKRPIEEGKKPLVETVWQLMVQGKLLDALDERLGDKGEFNEEEVERVLHLGLLCAYPDPNSRPTMRQVVKILDGKTNQEGCDQSENEDMDAYLLEKMNSNDLWSNYSQSFGYCSYTTHPTFDEIRQGNSSSMSLSWSNTTVQGR